MTCEEYEATRGRCQGSARGSSAVRQAAAPSPERRALQLGRTGAEGVGATPGTAADSGGREAGRAGKGRGECALARLGGPAEARGALVRRVRACAVVGGLLWVAAAARGTAGTWRAGPARAPSWRDR